MIKELEQIISNAVKKLFDTNVEPELSRPDEQFGDYSTNVALQLGKQLNKNPREVADAIKNALTEATVDYIERVEVAGPGFINLWLKDDVLAKNAFELQLSRRYQGQEILVEFGDPNPLKVFHLGHLYTTIVGDTIARLFETAGAKVHRLSYHGDVGMHVAKAVWAIGQYIGWDVKRLKELEAAEIQVDDQLLSFKTVIGYFYALGAQAFEEEGHAAEEIKAVNASVYKKDREDLNTIYEWGVKRSFVYFDQIFEELGVKYENRYLESESANVATETVKANVGKVFEESEGAIVYKGEKVGLHTRVFITSAGLPTYEAKDLGLARLKDFDYPEASKSVVITANEQAEYFKVMLAALKEIEPRLAEKTVHISHGFLSLTTGKMSSRTGNVFGAQTLMDDVRATVNAAYPNSDVQREVYLAALKYTFLKNRIGGDIVFDIQESVSLDGNSGPYLQYAHARACSILAKSLKQDHGLQQNITLEKDERSLVRKISEFTEVVDRAVSELMSHHICGYLYELAQNFNSFYEHNRVIGDPREAVRLRIVQAYADTLNSGLNLLGIPAPDHM